MCTVDEDIEMLAKLAFRIHQVELDWRILLYDLIHYFLHCRSWYVKFRLIINIIFHHGGEAYGWHEGIVIQQTGKQVIFSNQKEDDPKTIFFILPG